MEPGYGLGITAIAADMPGHRAQAAHIQVLIRKRLFLIDLGIEVGGAVVMAAYKLLSIKLRAGDQTTWKRISQAERDDATVA